MIIDLTHSINSDILVYPGTPRPEIELSNNLDNDGFVEHYLSLSTHTGTHIDAPRHMLKDGKSVDEYRLEKFTGKALLIDCRKYSHLDWTLIKKYEKDINTIDFVVFNTGWNLKWNNDSYFLDFPVLENIAAEYLSQFSLKAVGFDTISIDPVSDSNYTNHHIFLKKDILIIENLTNLELIPSKIFKLYAIPLKIEDTDGSPVRAFAEVEE